MNNENNSWEENSIFSKYIDDKKNENEMNPNEINNVVENAYKTDPYKAHEQEVNRIRFGYALDKAAQDVKVENELGIKVNKSNENGTDLDDSEETEILEPFDENNPNNKENSSENTLKDLENMGVNFSVETDTNDSKKLVDESINEDPTIEASKETVNKSINGNKTPKKRKNRKISKKEFKEKVAKAVIVITLSAAIIIGGINIGKGIVDGSSDTSYSDVVKLPDYVENAIEEIPSDGYNEVSFRYDVPHIIKNILEKNSGNITEKSIYIVYVNSDDYLLAINVAYNAYLGGYLDEATFNIIQKNLLDENNRKEIKNGVFNEDQKENEDKGNSLGGR